LEGLLREAYILVKHVNFSYSDVKTMTKLERVAFIEFLIEEREKEKEYLDEIKHS